MTLLLFISGLVLLIVGAEALVRGATRLSNLIGLSPLIIGLTVVAWGTSSPELVVSISASLQNHPEISLGNIIGSNIFNVLFILGASALIIPLVVSSQLIKLDVPIMIICSIALFVMGLDGELGLIDGILLIAGFVIYTSVLLIKNKNEKQGLSDEFAREYGQRSIDKPHIALFKYLLFIISGLALLVIGSRLLVEGARLIALQMGISQLVIGLTVVAAGTSLPEAATSIVASLRGERDIAVGNIVGSNIFNILCVLGFATIFAPGGIEISKSILYFDISVMIAVAVACLPVFFTGNLIARWEGALFLAYYAAYMVYLVFSVITHNYLTEYTYAMLFFVLPLTSVTLVVIMMRTVYRDNIRKRDN